MQNERRVYDDQSVRYFIWAAFGWGFFGIALGIVLGLQTLFPILNLSPALSFGRLRPLHTQLTLFALLGNFLFALVYYSTQRLCRVRMANDGLSAAHFWGWQTLLIGQFLTLALGWTQGRIYAEPEWPLDLYFLFVWCAFALNFFRTLRRRQTPRLYVSLWFYIAFVVMVGIIHVVNNLVFPVYGARGYSLFAGIYDALIQEWYRNCLLAFFVTAPSMGALYYFLPKISGQPVYSHRLAVIHFWAFIFISPWVAPRFLLNTFVPDWAQSMGMLFSIMLWAPAWAGVLNGMLTLRGAWGRFRAEPALFFLLAAIVSYAIGVMEAPWLAIRAVSAITLFTPWVSASSHFMLMGWCFLLVVGVVYWLVPRLYGTPLYSSRRMWRHFWVSVVALLTFVAAGYFSAITQGLIWEEKDSQGQLVFPGFSAALQVIRPWSVLRLVAGSAWAIEFVVMAKNMWATRSAGSGAAIESVPHSHPIKAAPPQKWHVLGGRPVVVSALVVTLLVAYLRAGPNLAVLFFAAFVFISVLVWAFNASARQFRKDEFHLRLEGQHRAFALLVWVTVSVAPIVMATLMPWPDDSPTGRAVEMPMAMHADVGEQIVDDGSETQISGYRPLEIHGRAIYLREGCQYCHTRMIRGGTADTIRFGDVSEAYEYRYEHPYLGGTLRMGPDLHRLGEVRTEAEIFRALVGDTPESSSNPMPDYAWLLSADIEVDTTAQRMREYRRLGTPYSEAELDAGYDDAVGQAREISENIRREEGREISWRSEMVALIAYLKRDPKQ